MSDKNTPAHNVAWVIGAVLGAIVRFVFFTFFVYLSVQTLIAMGLL